MFLDDPSIKFKETNHYCNLLSSTLKQNVVKQAASKLLQHLTYNKNIYYLTHNSNANALDEYHRCSAKSRKDLKRELQRTDKCNSWLFQFSSTNKSCLNQ